MRERDGENQPATTAITFNYSETYIIFIEYE
jgi:hypothetical protein